MSLLPLSRSGRSVPEIATEAVEKAGEILLEHFHHVEQIEFKGRGNIVTDVDLLVERKVVTFLQNEYPAHSILSEETRGTATDSAYCWILDPLDGTNNYAFGIPFFSVSLALTLKEEVLFGLVYDPIRKELFRVEKGAGAFLDGQPISVSQKTKLRACLIGCDMGYDDEGGKLILQTLSSLWPGLHSLRIMGSASLGLAYVACGRFDLYFHRCLFPWDLATDILLIREAGGIVTDWEGRPATIHSRQLIAANDAIQQEFMGLLRDQAETRRKI